MDTVDIHEAGIHLSRLDERAARGEPVIIAEAGKPMVNVVLIDVPGPKLVRRFGILEGIDVPPDFDDLAREEIESMFHGGGGARVHR